MLGFHLGRRSGGVLRAAVRGAKTANALFERDGKIRPYSPNAGVKDLFLRSKRTPSLDVLYSNSFGPVPSSEFVASGEAFVTRTAALACGIPLANPPSHSLRVHLGDTPLLLGETRTLSAHTARALEFRLGGPAPAHPVALVLASTCLMGNSGEIGSVYDNTDISASGRGGWEVHFAQSGCEDAGAGVQVHAGVAAPADDGAGTVARAFDLPARIAEWIASAHSVSGSGNGDTAEVRSANPVRLVVAMAIEREGEVEVGAEIECLAEWAERGGGRVAGVAFAKAVFVEH